MRVDFHTHVLPPEWPDLAERYGDPRWPQLEHVDDCSARIRVGGEVFREVTDQCYDAGRRLESMAATGIDRQVLSTVPVMFSYWADPQGAAELCRHLNEHIAATVAEHPDSFVGLGTLPMQDTGLAVAELERCVGELGLAGIEIGTNVNAADLDDPALFPVFERAAELGAVVFVHPWQMMSPDRLRRFALQFTLGMPTETAYAFGALAFGGVLDRLPDLKVVLAHGGGSAPALIGRMQRGWEIFDYTREAGATAPIDQLGRCWFDSMAGDAASLELLVRRVGAERVMLGTDYPFAMGEGQPGAVVESSALDPEQRELVLGAAAARLLGLAAETVR